MSSNVVYLYSHQPLQVDPDLNEALRQIDDGQRSLLNYIDEVLDVDVTTWHKRVHQGEAFIASSKQTGLTDASSEVIRIKTGSNYTAHLRAAIRFGRGDIDVDIYEGATFSADGTEITPYNLNRASSLSAETAIYVGPTVSTDGTLIQDAWVEPTAAGQGNRPGDGSAFFGQSDNDEIILKKDTEYLLRITNNSGATIDWALAFEWYEPGLAG